MTPKKRADKLMIKYNDKYYVLDVIQRILSHCIQFEDIKYYLEVKQEIEKL